MAYSVRRGSRKIYQLCLRGLTQSPIASVAGFGQRIRAKGNRFPLRNTLRNRGHHFIIVYGIKVIDDLSSLVAQILELLKTSRSVHNVNISERERLQLK